MLYFLIRSGQSERFPPSLSPLPLYPSAKVPTCEVHFAESGATPPLEEEVPNSSWVGGGTGEERLF